MTTRKIRIQNDGESYSYHTKVTDAETGEAIPYIRGVSLNFDALSGPIVARLEVPFPVLDVIADATIKQVCPYCGKEVHQPNE